MRSPHLDDNQLSLYQGVSIVSKTGKKVSKKGETPAMLNGPISDHAIINTQALLQEIRDLRCKVAMADETTRSTRQELVTVRSDLLVARDTCYQKSEHIKDLVATNRKILMEIDSMRTVVKNTTMNVEQLKDELNLITASRDSVLSMMTEKMSINDGSSHPLVETFKMIAPELSLECSICFESWSINNKPCVLNCGHIICHNCALISNLVECPLCREVITSKSSHCVEYSKLSGLCMKLSSLLNKKE